MEHEEGLGSSIYHTLQHYASTTRSRDMGGSEVGS
jgi:hypothetical protein